MDRKWIKVGVAAILALVTVCSSVYWVNKALKNDVDSFTRVQIHEMYASEDNIDVLILGASHSNRGVDAELLDEIWGLNAFNLSTSSQRLDGSYALLKEAAKYHDLESVYVELSLGLMGADWENDWTNWESTFVISDYLRISWNKLAYIVNACPKEYYTEAFFPFLRSRNNFSTKNYVNEQIEKKKEEPYISYDYSVLGDGITQLHNKGFVSVDSVIEDWPDPAAYAIVPDPVLSENDREYMKKIIDFCEKKSIKIVFFSAPITEYARNATGNYESFGNQITDFLNQYGVSYYDFSYFQADRMALKDDCFYDDNHLNMKGADIFTRVFGETFKETGK